jgi:hypothetical protein
MAEETPCDAEQTGDQKPQGTTRLRSWCWVMATSRRLFHQWIGKLPDADSSILGSGFTDNEVGAAGATGYENVMRHCASSKCRVHASGMPPHEAVWRRSMDHADRTQG